MKEAQKTDELSKLLALAIAVETTDVSKREQRPMKMYAGRIRKNLYGRRNATIKSQTGISKLKLK